MGKTFSNELTDFNDTEELGTNTFKEINGYQWNNTFMRLGCDSTSRIENSTIITIIRFGKSTSSDGPNPICWTVFINQNNIRTSTKMVITSTFFNKYFFSTKELTRREFILFRKQLW